MKEKNLIIVFVLLIIGSISLMIFSAVNKTPSALGKESVSHSQLTLSEASYDFGNISMEAGNVSKVIKLTNNTNKEIKLSELGTSCMCTSAYILKEDTRKGPYGMIGMSGPSRPNESILPGENLEIEVVYDPAAHGPAGLGQISRIVYLADSNGGTLEFEITANVTP